MAMLNIAKFRRRLADRPRSLRVRVSPGMELFARTGLGFFGSWSVVLLAVLCHTAQPFAAALSKDQLDFFETRIRPIFVENCYKCHSPAKGKIKGGLELDWQRGWEKGGESGPAIVPGSPEKSLLIKAVRYADSDLQMPPKGDRLSDTQINDLVKWVERGAPDPRTQRPAANDYASAGKDHWAFKPVARPTLPLVKNTGWVKNEVDRFILAKLEADGMTPNEAADQRTLLRRVYFDLIGLPPTPEEVTGFLQDASPNAFEKVVDKLLASPRYGERWARHWLDLARYSDSKGQFDRRRESSVYPSAWTYRDYVINAFNDDKPYDRFIIEQLAADQLSLGTNRSALAALGFLTLGDHFNGNMSDIINDRIDVVTKGFLGLTVSCARCHDHKLDPIPQADYYSLHGIFASSVEPRVKPEISDPKTNPTYEEYLKQRSELDARMLNVRTQGMATVFGDFKRLAGVYLYAAQMPEKDRDGYLKKVGGNTGVLKHWQQVSRGGGQQAKSIFGLWNMLTRIPEARFALQAPRLLANLDQREQARRLNPYVIEAFRGKGPRSLAEAAVMYGNLFAKTDPAWQATLATVLENATVRFLPPRERMRIFALREQSDMLDMVHPGAPARASVLLDSPTPKDSPIFLRGQAENPGEIVPRRFLEALSGPNRPAFRIGSGRLELAQAIASTSNPLSARVLVNRVWMHHCGEGFVTTPDDLGNQSAPPSHSELLDFLASRFMEDGWSIKQLHKLIVLSASYQQSTKDNPINAEKDPFNRLLWRANVRRLEFEPLRDSILYLGGNLDLTLGGHPVDLSQGTHKSQRPARAAMLNRVREFRLAGGSRRTIYGYIDRADLFEELNTFDFANPSSAMGKRYETTVPQQVLFLMNSRLVVEQVRKVVNRDEFKAQKKPSDRIRYLYELFFQRPPTDEEVRAGVEFVSGPARDGADSHASLSESASVVGQVNDQRPDKLDSAGTPNARRPLNRWQEYAHALLLTNEASFVN